MSDEGSILDEFDQEGLLPRRSMADLMRPRDNTREWRRCGGRNKNGGQCRRRTGYRGPLGPRCPAHKGPT